MNYVRRQCLLGQVHGQAQPCPLEENRIQWKESIREAERGFILGLFLDSLHPARKELCAPLHVLRFSAELCTFSLDRNNEGALIGGCGILRYYLESTYTFSFSSLE